MKVYELKCSNCGADLKVSADRKIIFCEYCGTKNLIDDEIIRSEVNHSGTVSYRDEAKLRELELKEAERIREENKRKAAFRRWHIVLLIGVVVAFALGLVSALSPDNIGADWYKDITVITLECMIIPFFYPYSYSKRGKVLNYIIYVILGMFLFTVSFIIGMTLGEFITGKMFA